jgi:ribosomal protein S18 acetylase RimI-like enzyme
MLPLSAIVTLKDGRQVVLRPLAAADAGELADFNRETAEDYGHQVSDPDEAVTDAGALREMLAGNDDGGGNDGGLLRKEEGDRGTHEGFLRKGGRPGERGVGAPTQSGGFLLGAFLDSSLLGTVSLFVVSLRKVAHVGEIGLAVLPSFKGVGLGRALLLAAVSEARRRGFVKLVVRVFADNEPALALYRSAGFIEEGRQVRQYFFRDGTYRDGIWMAKFLE